MVTTKDFPVVIPADWVPGPLQGFWTYDDYTALLDDGHRYEIVNGVLVMAPAPDLGHQSIVLRLSHYLFVYAELAGLGRVFAAPIDVELGLKNVFQPDVVVILNAHLDRLTEKKIIGAPDLAVEVLVLENGEYRSLGVFNEKARLPSRVVPELPVDVEQFFV